MMSGEQWGLAIALVIASGSSLIAGTTDVPDSQSQSYVSNSQRTSKFISQDFVPDGNLNKTVWRSAPWVKVDQDAYKPIAYPQSATDIASLWTRDYVYFAFRCKYTSLNVYEGGDPSKDFMKLWERDVVEIFLNPHPEHMNQYYEFEVAPNNLWIDLEIDRDHPLPNGGAGWNSGFEHVTHIDAAKHVWTCEMRIPVAQVNAGEPLAANAQWRINFYRDDGPSDKTRRALAWSMIRGGTESFHTPSCFGLIRFVK
jgi:hypothetical protein